MNKVTSFAIAIFIMIPSAAVADYCDDQFEKDLTAANGELGAIYAWQKDAQQKADKDEMAKKTITAAMTNVGSSAIDANQKVQMINAYLATLSSINAEEDAINNENHAKLQRINELKGSVPQNIKDKAKNCAQEVAPANMIVNIAVQGLAMYFTDGASLILPKRALYVDMGEIMHGNVMGGSNSAPNEAKDWINDRLGTHF